MPPETISQLISRHNSRAIKNGARGTLTVDEWRNIVDAFGWRCAYCKEYSGTMQLDHVIPISSGGNTDRYNVVPCCERCNNRKRDNGVFDFANALLIARLVNTLEEIKHE